MLNHITVSIRIRNKTDLNCDLHHFERLILNHAILSFCCEKHYLKHHFDMFLSQYQKDLLKIRKKLILMVDTVLLATDFFFRVIGSN